MSQINIDKMSQINIDKKSKINILGERLPIITVQSLNYAIFGVHRNRSCNKANPIIYKVIIGK